MSGSKHILLIFSLLLCYWVDAQVNVRSNIDRDKILIGETILLTVEAYVPTGADVIWIKSDTIPHFEIVNRSETDTAQNIDTKKFSQQFDITSFDSGQQYIPPFEVTVNGQQYYTDSLMIEVAYTPFNPEDDYRDIKDIIDVKKPAKDYLPWVMAAVALVLLAVLLFFWFRKRRQKPLAKPVEVISPYEEAMRALTALSKRNVHNGEVKAYYSEMNDILRKYIVRKFSVSAFEHTNDELLVHLSGLGIPKDDLISLAQSLRMSDVVKFARYMPGDEDNKANLKIVSSSIDILDKKTTGAV